MPALFPSSRASWNPRRGAIHRALVFFKVIQSRRLKPQQQVHETCLRRFGSESAQADFVLLLLRFQPPGD